MKDIEKVLFLFHSTLNLCYLIHFIIIINVLLQNFIDVKGTFVCSLNIKFWEARG